MEVYADSNVFVRLYLPQFETPRAIQIVSGLSGSFLPISWLHEVEICAAIEQMRFHSKNGAGPSVTPEQAMVAQAQFTSDIYGESFCRRVTFQPSKLAAQAKDLALRYSANTGQKTYDILHVAQALDLGCNTFWSFDKKANQLAKSEGLDTIE